MFCQKNISLLLRCSIIETCCPNNIELIKAAMETQVSSFDFWILRDQLPVLSPKIWHIYDKIQNCMRLLFKPTSKRPWCFSTSLQWPNPFLDFLTDLLFIINKRNDFGHVEKPRNLTNSHFYLLEAPLLYSAMYCFASFACPSLKNSSWLFWTIRVTPISFQQGCKCRCSRSFLQSEEPKRVRQLCKKYVSRHWHKVRLGRPKDLAASKPLDCNVML